jgi:signal transduction histidine kinase
MNHPPTTAAGGTRTPQASAATPGASPKKHGWFHLRIGQQFFLCLLVSVLLTLSASLVAYYSFHEILQYGSRLAESGIPNLSSAVGVTRQSAIVVNGALHLIAAASLAEHQAVAEELAEERSLLGDLIYELESRAYELESREFESRSIPGGSISLFGGQSRMAGMHLADIGLHLADIEGQLADIDLYLGEIQESAARRLAIANTLERLKEELAETNRLIEHHLVVAIDDQGFYLIEGLRDLEDQPSPIAERASEAELAYYRDLVTVNHQANLASLLLGDVLFLSDRSHLPILQGRFRSAVQNYERAYERLSARMPDSALGENLERLARLGESGEGIITLRREVLRRLEQEQEALARGREASVLLLAAVNSLVTDVNDEAVSVSNASQSAVRTGRLLLTLVNVLSISAALLIGWLFVGRYLIRRLVGLATAMRSMAGGDLEVPVEVRGHDEVADMADALEVFRRHALEVQRLNLVEKLAQELDAKNHTLEEALENLQKMQEQMVAEQKLASLGQLAAGVAHEIKNPLNFVTNFSEVSVELIDELDEVMTEIRAKEERDLAGEIEPILSDLRLNLHKVKEHGERADGIVRSMLEHSRSAPGDWRETDLNALLKQYVNLAYHSMRAHGQGFNATLRQDLDPEIGMVEVVPQEISRAFLNLITNAYQALDEKRRMSTDPDYEPELRVATRRLAEQAEVCIRDNGPGISEELRERIFEPFVTTKAPGEGTGLGLSLTMDILARHGGAISLDTEAGAFTEMRIVLPLRRPLETADAASQAEED